MPAGVKKKSGPKAERRRRAHKRLMAAEAEKDHQDCKCVVARRNGKLPQKEDIIKRYAEEETEATQACREEPPNLGEAAGHCGQSEVY